MKRILYLCLTCLLMTTQGAVAEDGKKLRVSAGPILLYDDAEQEAGVGAQLTMGYPLKPGFEVELFGAKSNHFGADNDLTDGDVSISIFTLGGRYHSLVKGDCSGYVSFGAGVMRLDAENAPAEGSDERNGGVARFGVGVDHYLSRQWGLRWGAGFSRGLGGTKEISVFDFSVSFFFQEPM